MMPDNVASTVVQFAPPMTPVKTLAPEDLLVGFERGGIALSDPSQGLDLKLWTLSLRVNAEAADEVVVSDGSTETVLFTGEDIEELDLAFDQNMRPMVAYVQAGVARYRWYDATIPGIVTVDLPVGSRSPRCCLDDHRFSQTAQSDIILMYCRGSTLYMRMQRERFLVEYTIATVGPDATLVYVTMNNLFRLQWQINRYTATITPQVTQRTNPFLADVVSDICRRNDLPANMIDVSELYDDTVAGYLCKSDDGADVFLRPLSTFYFFDPTEYDRQIHFYKRGRDVAGSFSWNDLVERDNSALEPMKMKRRDMSKLPRTVNVTHIDPAGNYARNKQMAERKSNLIRRSKVNKNLESNLVLEADDAASIATQTIKMFWWELMEYEWALPIGFTHWVAGDVANYFAKDGSTHRIRIETRNEDSGEIKFTGVQDGGTDVYQTRATGLSLPYPESTTPGIVGETLLEILNISVMRDQDDELGVYVAVAGQTEAWYGAAVEFSTDGINYVEAFRTEIPAIMGESTTALAADEGYEYPSAQTVTVRSNFALESISLAEIESGMNRAVLGDEVLQFQTVLPLGSDLYRLSGLVRGRYNTEAAAWPIGTRFVLLDNGVTFLRAQQWMLGTEIWVRPTSFGVTTDDSVPTSYEFDVAYTQNEWPPIISSAERDVSDNVTVNWIPRPRLGVESNPYNSKYFTGFRIRFSDDVTADVGPDAVTYTRASTPGGVTTVSVVGLNSITGEGTPSEVTTIIEV